MEEEEEEEEKEEEEKSHPYVTVLCTSSTKCYASGLKIIVRKVEVLLMIYKGVGSKNGRAPPSVIFTLEKDAI